MLSCLTANHTFSSLPYPLCLRHLFCACLHLPVFANTVAPGAQEAVGLAGGAAIQVPHELPGQDPEGGSEVNFGDESSEATATPRADGELSRRASSDIHSFQDGRPSTDGLGRTPNGSLAATAAAGAAATAAVGGVPALGVPETALGAGAVPAAGRGGAADSDGLGGSWQDLQVLRAQSMASRSSALHYTHVSTALLVSAAAGGGVSPAAAFTSLIASFSSWEAWQPACLWEQERLMTLPLVQQYALSSRRSCLTTFCSAVAGVAVC